MTESKLNPFDAELLVMIGDIAKSQPEVEEKPDRYEITVDTTEIQGNAIEALKQAVAGRLGKRLLVTHTLDAAVVFNVEYDPTEYPEQIRTRLVEPDGRLAILPEREFNREFEPKGVSVPKEPGDKGCGNCANFTNEDVNGNGYCEAFKCEQSCGVMPCQEYKPKNQ